jgi:hypothetical protein
VRTGICSSNDILTRTIDVGSSWGGPRR